MAIRNQADADRDFEPLVREALSYWEANAADYGAWYTPEYELRPDLNSADIIVYIKPTVAECGKNEVSELYGCAHYVTEVNQDTRYPPLFVRVEAGYTDDSTVKILKHEFGHTLGLAHGDAPTDVMRATMQATARYPQPNVSERANPWREPTVTVALDQSEAHPNDHEKNRRQASHAVSFMNRKLAEDPSRNVTFTLIDDPEQADVVVEFPESLSCDLGRGSCRYFYGYDTDTDPSLEQYSNYTIEVSGVVGNEIGWHIGAGLADAAGLRGDDVPGVFQDASYEERQSEWWD